MAIRFDGQVVIVTGAGNGLGREYALGFAARGAKVLVNDLGCERDGSGSSAAVAEAVAEEIRAAGGEALADDADVTRWEHVQAMVQRAMAAWGRVDVLVNNAGVLRDKTMQKVSIEDFRAVSDVHLMGAVHCTQAVWEIMREQQYGRIIMITSSSGLYGNFGQSSYGAAKMGVIGLMTTLRIEGAKRNIRVNAIAPTAATRMTSDVIPQTLLPMLEARLVAPAALYLASRDAPSGEVVCAGAGCFSRVQLFESDPVALGQDASPEGVAEALAALSEMPGARPLKMGGEQIQRFMQRVMSRQNAEVG